MVLSQDEVNKIHEEEAERAKARAQYTPQNPQTVVTKKKTSCFTWGCLGSIILLGFIMFIGACSTAIISIKSPTATKDKTTTNAKATQVETQESSKPALAQHEVIPGDIQGTTRIIHVIVQTNITKDEVIAINDALINDYASGLTHLSIEYFDDKVVAVDYFQKISEVSEAESDELFKHYISTYKMNKSSGLSELNFHEGDGWTTIKEY